MVKHEIVIKNERQEKLLHMLEKESSMKVSELSERLNSSMMTIRRDLDFLEENGIVKRYHGGVVLTKQDIYQPSFFERIEERNEEKNAIAAEAVKLIKPGSIVFFDAGTTPLAVVEQLPDDIEFTAITTGLLTAVGLCNKPGINVVNIGGNIHHSSYSSISYNAVDMIRQFRADMAFISTKSITIPEGTCEAQLPLIEIKKTIVEVSDQVILLATSNKFESKSMCRAIAMEDIDLIITDDRIDKKYLDQLAELNKNVLLGTPVS